MIIRIRINDFVPRFGDDVFSRTISEKHGCLRHVNKQQFTGGLDSHTGVNKSDINDVGPWITSA